MNVEDLDIGCIQREPLQGSFLGCVFYIYIRIHTYICTYMVCMCIYTHIHTQVCVYTYGRLPIWAPVVLTKRQVVAT